MEDTYVELTQHLVEKYLAEDCVQQTWICIAGGPGSGKSTLAAELVNRVNFHAGSEVCVCLPMDGFHYSRTQLRHIAADSATRYGDKPSEPGGDDFPPVPVSMDDLLARRGAPWTFHCRALCQMLHKGTSITKNCLFST